MTSPIDGLFIYMRYDLMDLKVFQTVAETGNLSRGAELCFLAPSTVSLRIKGLEHAVGTALLVRHARGVSPTPAGEVMLEHIRRCFAQLQQMHADMLPFAQGLGGQVTLFANNNALSSHVPEGLARFFASYPSVRVTLKERTSLDIITAVATGRADVGIVALQAEQADLDFLPYREDQLVLLAPPDNKFNGLTHISFFDCLEEPFICLQSGAALHTFLVNQAMSLGGRLDVRVQVSGYRAIARLVSSGAGLGIVPRSALEPSDHQHLTVLNLIESWAQRDLRICIRRNPLEQNHFRDKLVEALRFHSEE